MQIYENAAVSQIFHIKMFDITLLNATNQHS